MRTMNRSAASKIFVLAVCIVFAGGHHVAALDLRVLLDAPKTFHQKRVSLTGVVIGDGPIFELYTTGADARDISPATESVFIRGPKSWPRDRPYHLHRVRVTGIINAKRHGIWGNPCEMSLEKIEVLSKGPVVSTRIPYGAFRNAGKKTVSVQLIGPAGLQAKFQILPQQTVSLPINDGAIKVFADGKLLDEAKLGVARASRFYDSKYGVFYYRIADGQVEQVRPALVDYWEWSR